MKKFIVSKVNSDGTFYPKTQNKYLIINTDEPYAEKVFEIIKKAEKEKKTWDAPDNFEEFVKLI